MDEESNYHFASGQLDLLDALKKSGKSLGESSRDMKSGCSVSDSTNNEAISSKIPIPETLLIVDTETTGLDVENDSCIEVGVILFNVPSRAVLAQQSFLLPVELNEAEPINRIPSHITRLNQPIQLGLSYLQGLIEAADLLVAHNASFDKQWFGKPPLPEVTKRWLCTMDDVSWPSERQLRQRPSVRDLALAYGVPVWSAHRALTDCIYLAEVFCRCDDLETLLIHGLEPRKLMRARISYEQRHLARNAGFRWNDSIKGAWTRRMSVREVSKLTFPVDDVETLDKDS